MLNLTVKPCQKRLSPPQKKVLGIFDSSDSSIWAAPTPPCRVYAKAAASLSGRDQHTEINFEFQPLFWQSRVSRISAHRRSFWSQMFWTSLIHEVDQRKNAEPPSAVRLSQCNSSVDWSWSRGKSCHRKRRASCPCPTDRFGCWNILNLQVYNSY
jgi:hypothetical protein